MRIEADTVDEYISALPPERANAIAMLRSVISEHLPPGFEESMSYGMPGWVVPHTRYPAGYHCKPSEALPFLSIASQKNFVAVYHMGIYADPDLLAWFEQEYPKHSTRRLDMGKSCIRFKKLDQIPHDLIGELATKMTVDDWIARYESAVKR